MSERWISTKQAAELLGVSQRTIQNWVDEGKLKSSRTAGGHRRLDPDEIGRFVRENYQHHPETIRTQASSPAEPKNELLRVLVIEDDFNLLRLCELRFGQFTIPHQLYLTSNVFQSLIMIGKYQPHVIFTDLKMPKINGLQLISEIINLPELRQTRIVVITGLDTRDIMTMGVLPDGLMILPKPIPFNTIETILYQQAQALALATSVSTNNPV